VVSSPAFAKSKRAQEFLSLVVRHAVRGQLSHLRERMIGTELFGRPVGYDTGSDSVVRVMATEVRRRLLQFYLESNTDWPVRIELLSGSYEPHFLFANAQPEPKTSPLPDALKQENIELKAANIEVPSPAAETIEVNAEVVPPVGKWKARRVLVFVACASLLIAGTLLALYKKYRESTPDLQQIHSVVILPLKNLSGDPSQEYFADGMTAELISNLGQISTLRVISITSSMNYKGTHKMLPEIARDLGVEGVVEGGIEREGNQVRINAQLIDARTDRPIWTQTYVRDMTSVLDLQGEVAQAIAREISITVTPQEQTRLARNRTINPTAHDLYLRGLLLLNHDDPKGASQYFRQAIAVDPKSAQAHTGLADCLWHMGNGGMMASMEAFAAQKSEAQKAVELDPSSADAHAELAYAEMGLEWDWKSADNEFRRAVELNPNSASIQGKYAIYLLFTGQTQEAISRVEHGVELDPVSAVSLRDEAFIYIFAHKYDKALSLLETVRSLGIHPPDWPFLLGAAYSGKGQFAESIQFFERCPKDAHNLGHLGYAYARAGQIVDAQKAIALIKQEIRSKGIGTYEIAFIYAGLGDKRNAIYWLNQAYAAHDTGLLYINVDPCLDSLRAEPEFQELVRKVGLTP
jgi:TolB-like protein/cytochrome c-type biogenesis protein CcmH/NrfG